MALICFTAADHQHQHSRRKQNLILFACFACQEKSLLELILELEL